MFERQEPGSVSVEYYAGKKERKKRCVCGGGGGLKRSKEVEKVLGCFCFSLVVEALSGKP